MEDSSTKHLCPLIVKGGDSVTTSSSDNIVSFYGRHDDPEYEYTNDISILQSVVLDKMMKLTTVISCSRITGKSSVLDSGIYVSDFYLFEVEVCGSLLESVNWEKRSFRERYLEKLNFFKEKQRSIDSKLAVLLERREEIQRKMQLKGVIEVFETPREELESTVVNKVISQTKGIKERIEGEIKRIEGYLKSGSFTRKLRILMYKNKYSVLLDESTVVKWAWTSVKHGAYRKYCVVKKIEEEKTRRVSIFYKALIRTDVTRFLGHSRELSKPPEQVLYDSFGSLVATKNIDDDDMDNLASQGICLFGSKMIFYRGELVVDDSFCSVTVPSRFKHFRTIHLTPAFFERFVTFFHSVQCFQNVSISHPWEESRKSIDNLMKFLLSVKRKIFWLPAKSSLFPSGFLDRLIFLLLCFQNTTNEFSLLSNDVVLYSILPWLSVLGSGWWDDFSGEFKSAERSHTLINECKEGQILELATGCPEFLDFHFEVLQTPFGFNDLLGNRTYFCESMDFYTLAIKGSMMSEISAVHGKPRGEVINLILRRVFESLDIYFHASATFKPIDGSQHDQNFLLEPHRFEFMPDAAVRDLGYFICSTAKRVFERGFRFVLTLLDAYPNVVCNFLLSEEEEEVVKSFTHRLNCAGFAKSMKVCDEEGDLFTQYSRTVEEIFLKTVRGGKWDLWPLFSENNPLFDGMFLSPKKRHVLLESVVKHVYDQEFFSFTHPIDESVDENVVYRNRQIVRLVLIHFSQSLKDLEEISNDKEFVEELDTAFGLMNSIFHWDSDAWTKKDGEEGFCASSCTEILGIVLKFEREHISFHHTTFFSFFGDVTLRDCSFQSKQFWEWVKKWCVSLCSIPLFHNVYTTFWDPKTDAAKFLQQFQFGIQHFKEYSSLVMKFLNYVSLDIIGSELFGFFVKEEGTRASTWDRTMGSNCLGDWNFIFTFIESVLLNIKSYRKIQNANTVNNDDGNLVFRHVIRFERKVVEVLQGIALVFFKKFKGTIVCVENTQRSVQIKNGLLELSHLFLFFLFESLSFCTVKKKHPLSNETGYLVLSDVISHSICCVYQSIPTISLMMGKGEVSTFAERLLEYLIMANVHIWNCGGIEFSTQEFVIREGDNFMRKLSCTLNEASIRLSDRADVKKIYLVNMLSEFVFGAIPLIMANECEIFRFIEKNIYLRSFHQDATGLELVFQFFSLVDRMFDIACKKKEKAKHSQIFHNLIRRIFEEETERTALNRLLPVEDCKCSCVVCKKYKSSFETLFFHKAILIAEDLPNSHACFNNKELSRWIIGMRERFMIQLVDLVLEKKDLSILSSFIAPDRYVRFLRYLFFDQDNSNNYLFPGPKHPEFLRRATKFLSLVAEKVAGNSEVGWNRLAMTKEILTCFLHIRAFTKKNGLCSYDWSAVMLECVISLGHFVLKSLKKESFVLFDEEEVLDENKVEVVMERFDEVLLWLCGQSIYQVMHAFCVSTLPKCFYMFKTYHKGRRIYHPYLSTKAYLLKETAHLSDICLFFQFLLKEVQKLFSYSCLTDRIDYFMTFMLTHYEVEKFFLCLSRLVWSSFEFCPSEKIFMETALNTISFFHAFYDRHKSTSHGFFEFGSIWIFHLNRFLMHVLSRTPHYDFDALSEVQKGNCRKVVNSLCDFLDGIEIKDISSELMLVLISSRWTLEWPLTQRILKKDLEHLSGHQIAGILDIINSSMYGNFIQRVEMPLSWKFGNVLPMCKKGVFDEIVLEKLFLQHRKKIGDTHPIEEHWRKEAQEHWRREAEEKKMKEKEFSIDPEAEGSGSSDKTPLDFFGMSMSFQQDVDKRTNEKKPQEFPSDRFEFGGGGKSSEEKDGDPDAGEGKKDTFEFSFDDYGVGKSEILEEEFSGIFGGNFSGGGGVDVEEEQKGEKMEEDVQLTFSIPPELGPVQSDFREEFGSGTDFSEVFSMNLSGKKDEEQEVFELKEEFQPSDWMLSPQHGPGSEELEIDFPNFGETVGDDKKENEQTDETDEEEIEGEKAKKNDLM